MERLGGSPLAMVARCLVGEEKIHPHHVELPTQSKYATYLFVQQHQQLVLPPHHYNKMAAV
jgi:hypothetical protein